MAVGEAFLELVEIMARLRRECPWDRRQTHRSLEPYVIEEAYEVVDAVEAGDFEELKKELGDLLLQVVFHAELAREEGRFGIEDVLVAICEKLRRRHPHVFGDVTVSGAEEVLRNWARIKAEERAERGADSVFAGVPRALPALLRAHRLGEKAARVGFDWRDADAVWEKVREEVAEVDRARSEGGRDRVEREVGDLLFALASFCRHLDLDAEGALRRALDRFERRFARMEELLRQRGRRVEEASPEELDAAWEEAKRHVPS
ncbi:MAG: nucleoside triphosphate pyrophosphohydrolase [Candidatus Binatia bacterium]|nr:MAG: nucleoside triphosphate pyrophosphohydrolase [Candidatus Binatia bacterium]